jgi:hypothetical protein
VKRARVARPPLIWGELAVARHENCTEEHLRAWQLAWGVVLEILEVCLVQVLCLEGLWSAEVWDTFLPPEHLPFPKQGATRVWGSPVGVSRTWLPAN